MVQTANDGVHRYCKKPAARIVGTNGLKWNGRETGIDIQTGNQHVVVPPSMVDGKPYRWLTPLVPRDELPELPKEWIEYLSSQSKPQSAAANNQALDHPNTAQ